MKKLSLDLDQLSVESFDTAPDAERMRGTVEGNGSYTVAPYPSCVNTCGASPPPDTDICYEARPTLKNCCV